MKRKFALILVSVLLAACCAVLPASASASTGSSSWTESTETVTYDRIEETSYELTNGFPYFIDSYTVPFKGACGPIAGGMILSYYAKTYPALLPDYNGIGPDGQYHFAWSIDIEDAVTALYHEMGTDANPQAGGTTVMGFKVGLKNYVDTLGYQCGYLDLSFRDDFWFDYYQLRVGAGMPAALFFSKPCLTNYQTSGKQRTYFKRTGSVAHIMVGTGWRVTKYYRVVNGAEVLFRTDTLLTVADGFGNKTYVLMDDIAVLDYAGAVIIQ